MASWEGMPEGTEVKSREHSGPQVKGTPSPCEENREKDTSACAETKMSLASGAGSGTDQKDMSVRPAPHTLTERAEDPRSSLLTL